MPCGNTSHGCVAPCSRERAVNTNPRRLPARGFSTDRASHTRDPCPLLRAPPAGGGRAGTTATQLMISLCLGAEETLGCLVPPPPPHRRLLCIRLCVHE